VKRFVSRLSWLRTGNWPGAPHWLGSDPVRPFLLRSTKDRFCRPPLLPQLTGSGPLNALLPRFRVCSAGS